MRCWVRYGVGLGMVLGWGAPRRKEPAHVEHVDLHHGVKLSGFLKLTNTHTDGTFFWSVPAPPRWFPSMRSQGSRGE